MHRLKRIFTLSMSSGIAPRDERIIRICCSSPTAVPRDSWRESFLLDLSRKTNFNVCKKIAGKNASGSVSGKSDGQEELENSGKTYPEIIREYSEQIESKIARNEKKNRSSGIFSRMTIDRISSLTGMKKKDGGSSSDSSNSSGDATKKFGKYSDEGSEISVIIEPLPPDLHSNMSDMGIMMITVREKIASTHPFGVVDLRINGEPVTRVKQITRRFPNLNVTNSSGKCEIKIPITMSNKSVMNLSLSGPRRSESETDSSIRTTGRSSMSKIVPWWTTLESFRVLEIPRHLKIELQVSKNSPEEMKMPNNSEELSQVKVNSSPVEPGKSVTIFQSDKIINSWFNSNSKISPSHRFPETRLRYAPMKFIVPSIKNDKPIPKIGITRKSAIDSHSPGGKIMETGKTMRPITQGIDSLIDYKDRLPMEKNSERKLRQLEDSPEDQSRMPTEESIAEVIAKKSGARDGSLERIVKTRLKNPNTEPAKHPDDSERTTGPDAS
ncbi:uncharacterized protein [Fopius arisanus]|uniref:Uncharacterized protein n=1 Tax=Fopius arisanus TaxID=64838 RepID=A0A9R1SWP0_9HYME|nr:PREDICTED: uncharacterized protein LOC105263899 [Fopius arisanus]